MISGVLFDFDGTLLDCMKPMQSVFVSTAAELSSSVTEEGKNNVGENLNKVLDGKHSTLTGAVFIWRIGKFLGMPFHKRLLLVLLSYQRLRYIAYNSKIFNDAPQVLKTLKDSGIKMAIVTTRSKRETTRMLKKFSIDSYFGAVISRDDVVCGKPSPEPLIAALKTLGLKAEEAVMIGDMPTDIAAGKRAGTRTVGMNGSIFLRELIKAKPDALVNSLSEIPNVIAVL